MPGLIPAPNSGSFMEIYENIGSQMGQTDKKKYLIKKNFSWFFLTNFIKIAFQFYLQANDREADGSVARKGRQDGSSETLPTTRVEKRRNH
jgi:hypothetical protein